MKIPLGDIRRDLESRLNVLGVQEYRPAAKQIIDEVIMPILLAWRAEADQKRARDATLRQEMSDLIQELDVALLPHDPDAPSYEFVEDETD